jgi:group II intron reverse transcriptase/maturase
MTAKNAPGMAFTTLAHHIDVEWLRAAYRRTRKDGATGVDGQTAEQYEANLEANLQALLDRAKSGTYRAPPVRRVHIPKGDGSSTRPIGIPTFEDKVLQRAVAMLLEAIYEEDFYDFSYGFRPRRSAHQALEVLQNVAVKWAGGWVVEVDIRKFFDTLDHARLLEILRRRVRDGVILRLIGKWLNAGVLEGRELSFPDAGTPQGGVISPLLANVYLHEVVDDWFVRTVRSRLRDQATMVRYADDFVILCMCKDDAQRVMDVLPKRFGKYGLTLHPDKTRLISFRRPDRASPKEPPSTFDLLGFTHLWGRSLKGRWTVKRRTAKDRFARALRRVVDWCRVHRHTPVRLQWQALCLKLRGHFGYYGITSNMAAIRCFKWRVVRAWKKWLARRSNAGKTWASMVQLLQRLPLPEPRIVHRYGT